MEERATRRIVVTGVDGIPVRATAAEALLAGATVDERHQIQTARLGPAIDALRAAAAADPSAYVRLAALHALAGSSDPTLVPLVHGIATRDIDAGVRALASRMLASWGH